MTNPKSQIPNSNSERSSKPYDLKERSLEFAIRMVRVAAMLPRDSEGMVVRRQIARSGTSIGANIEEADGAISKRDKRKSFSIARKEARETRYSLRIIQRMWSSGVKVEADIVEATELLKILSAIVSKLE